MNATKQPTPDAALVMLKEKIEGIVDDHEMNVHEEECGGPGHCSWAVDLRRAIGMIERCEPLGEAERATIETEIMELLGRDTLSAPERRALVVAMARLGMLERWNPNTTVYRRGRASKMPSVTVDGIKWERP